MTTSPKIFKTSFFELLFKPLSFFTKLHSTNKRFFIFLLILGSVWLSLSSKLKMDGNYQVKWPEILTTSLISCFIGWLCFYVNALIGFLIAKLLGGKGSFKSIYVVFVYSFLPAIFFILTYILILPFDNEYLTPQLSSVIKGLLITINCIVFIWSLYIGLNGIRYFHKLSVLKALLAFLGVALGPVFFLSAFFLVY